MSVSVGTPQNGGSDSLEIYLLGTVDFDSALSLQHRLAEEIRSRNDRQAAMIVCEHPPLVTVGREGRPADLLWEPGEFVANRLPLRWIGRGGGVVVHGPGQLSVYPVVPLKRLNLSAAELRARIEEAVIDLCHDLKLPATRSPERSGVWCRNGRLAEVGLSVESWISSHGLFLNVESSVFLQRIVAARPGERTTSLASERHSGHLMQTARSSLVQHLASRLGYAKHHLYTGHPSLRRMRIKVPAHA